MSVVSSGKESSGAEGQAGKGKGLASGRCCRGEGTWAGRCVLRVRDRSGWPGRERLSEARAA